MGDLDAQVPAEELGVLFKQLLANPPDGPIRFTSNNGALVAEWLSGGSPCKFGPTITRPLPADL